MALFPKIDSPCPLGIDEQRRIAGYCSRCHKHVHALDGMGDAERRALLENASGPLCVSYRRPGSRTAMLAAVAITLVAGVAYAGEECADTAPLLPAQQVAQVTPVEPRADAIATHEGQSTTAKEQTLDEVILVGGISVPHEAEWIDDSGLPELPMRTEDSIAAAVVNEKDGGKR